MNVGKNLQLIRELNNYTQSYVAEKLGINQKTYSNLEKAENNVTVAILLQLSEIYEVSLAKILELNADTILNNNNQQGGTSYINNHATFYNGEKEMYQQMITQQANLIEKQQKLLDGHTTSK